MPNDHMKECEEIIKAFVHLIFEMEMREEEKTQQNCLIRGVCLVSPFVSLFENKFIMGKIGRQYLYSGGSITPFSRLSADGD
jgi:hypothetical protein